MCAPKKENIKLLKMIRLTGGKVNSRHTF